MDNLGKIKSILADYQDIFNFFPKAEVDKRYKFLLSEIKDFIEKYSFREQEDSQLLRVNEYSLLHAVLDYYSDIARLKNFHSIDRINEYKIVAYEMHWFLRRRPIQILADKNEELVFINEKFVLSYIMAFLTKEIEEKYGIVASLDVLNPFIDSFYYHLKYRNYTPQELELLLLSFHCGFECAIRGQEDLKQHDQEKQNVVESSSTSPRMA